MHDRKMEERESIASFLIFLSSIFLSAQNAENFLTGRYERFWKEVMEIP